MRILKFGGSSVASAERIARVIAIVKQKLKDSPLAVVVSAQAGVTDQLITAGRMAAAGDEAYKSILAELEQRHVLQVRDLLPVALQSSVLTQVKKMLNSLENTCEGVFLIGELSNKTLDKIMAVGELLSAYIIVQKMKALGMDAAHKDSRELLLTDNRFGKANLNLEVSNQRIREYFDCPKGVTVLPGFVANTEEGDVTTLGRGGSDYTAAILAGALQADALEIWTDVSGMMTADPRLVSQALPIKTISYEEAFELSHFGAKVIYPPTMQPVIPHKIPVWVKNTFYPEAHGTLIKEGGGDAKRTVRGISSMNKIALLSLQGAGMVGVPGFSMRLFAALAQADVNVVLITQSSSEHSISVAIGEQDLEAAQSALDVEFADQISLGRLDPLQVECGLAIIALVGDRMKSQPGVSGRMFSAFGRNGINIRAIAQGSSEKNISTVIDARDVKKGLNVLHEVFFETPTKQVNLFIAGVGTVGSMLLAQLKQQEEALKSNLRLSIRVVGLANSRKMIFNEEGLDLDTPKEDLMSIGEDMSLVEFSRRARAMNMRNAVFVDNSAAEAVAETYLGFLRNNISVVTCNKIAAASSYLNYKALKDASRDHQSSFLFETNVGAGLPIIGTLNDMMHSGDRIRRIEAVLSGSLNFIFNQFKGVGDFASVVLAAQAAGYTEPDPRLDLTGTDVMRKILILIRESGVEMEMAEIVSEPFMPADCLDGSVDQFFAKLEENASVFDAIYKEASARGEKLKFTAMYEEGRASVGLKSVGPDHPFYQLDGKDNIVLFSTDRYHEQPLIIKGAGAGAEVTASGLFADIIKTAVN